jgi:choline dehydrogenase-like flavoprotein
VRDETAGEIFKGVSFSKKVSKADQMKLDKGVDIIKKVFRKAGAKDSSILPLNPQGAHPSATCRIGDVVDRNLETEIKNLYCCDASVMPSALGLPVIWTVVALGKRLGKHLYAQLGSSASTHCIGSVEGVSQKVDKGCLNLSKK